MLKTWLELLAPYRCLGCAAEVDGPRAWCGACARTLQPGSQAIWSPWALEGPVLQAMRAAKADPSLDRARRLAGAAVQPFLERFHGRCGLVPVTTRASARRARGGCWVTRLAYCLGNTADWRVAGGVFEHTRRTLPQRRLSAGARAGAALDAWTVRALPPEDPSVRTWIVLDDVSTTGATLNAAGEALRSAGCANVELAAFATTPSWRPSLV